MTRSLRRAHVMAVVALAAVLVVTLPSMLARAVRISPPGTSPSVVSGDERVIAAARWQVGIRDTLSVVVLARDDPGNLRVRFEASSGARWPDAVIVWQAGDSATATADGHVVLGSIAAQVPLETRMPDTEGWVRLVSRAWSEELGAWRLPIPARQGQ